MKKWFLTWLHKLFSRQVPRYKVTIVEELPENLKPDVIYISDHKGFHWQVALLCPCGCNDILYVNLISEHKPHWKYKVEKKLITVYPSLHRKEKCHSHFFIVNGKIEWI